MYKLTINGHAPYGCAKDEYNEGEAVHIEIPFVTDVSTTITCADFPLPPMRCENYLYVYDFEMPPCDIDIQVTHTNNMMMRWAVDNNPPLMSMQATVQKESSLDESNNEVKYCSECGAKNPLKAKFCRECGTHFQK